MSNPDASDQSLINFIKELYGREEFIPLHKPVFSGHEKKYLIDCIDSTFVSSVGAYVDRFESMMCDITGARYAVATVNGTAALHIALILAGVRDGDEVITQPLSFVATCNAIAYERAHPVFVDVDRKTLSLSPDALREHMNACGVIRSDGTYNRHSGRRIAAVVPMHTFGLPGRTHELAALCQEWKLELVEDAAESLGSYEGGIHTGRVGRIGAFSLNGNKIATSGGGGCIVTDDPEIGMRAKHLTTTAKRPHAWDFVHDCVAFNYRLPNLNAALACAQLEQLPGFVSNKRNTAALYREFCRDRGIAFIEERPGSESNYWLNAILLDSRGRRDAFLKTSNDAGVMTRPVWTLMHRLPAFAQCLRSDLANAEFLEDRVVNIPSSVRQ